MDDGENQPTWTANGQPTNGRRGKNNQPTRGQRRTGTNEDQRGNDDQS